MKATLPHRYPFVLADRVDRLAQGDEATVLRRIAATDPLLDERGCLGAPLLAEALAQAAGIAAVGTDGSGARLAAIERFRCRGEVCAGDSLETRARIVRRFGSLVKARGQIRANGRLRAVGEVVLQIVRPE